MPKSADLHELQARMDEIVAGLPSDRPDRMRKKADSRARSPQANAEDDEAGKAYKKIVELVNASDKSERMIRDRLERLEFGEDAINDALSRAKDHRFIDDDRFARLLIRSRLSQGKGSAGIERELKEKGIDPFSLDGWPDEFCDEGEPELERALSLLERKPPRSKNQREGAYRRLVQYGYPTSTASSAARIWHERSRCFYGETSIS